MLEILISLIFVVIICSGFGHLASRFSLVLWQGLSGKLFSGLMTIATLLTVTAFVQPINKFVEIAVIAIGVISFFYLKTYRLFIHFYKTHEKYWITPLVFILFTASFAPFILDHFGYYLPTINWLSEFGLTKGLVNMDLILAQSSFWHILQTGFSHVIDPNLRLNTIVLIIYTLYIFEKKTWSLLIFLPLFYLFLQSPSPDLPVLAFSILILNELLHNNTRWYSLLLSSIFLFCIKPTLIWLPILVVGLIIKSREFSLKKILPCTALLLLFFIKNYITFGFPIVPLQLGDLNLPWKPNPEILRYSAQTAIEKTYDLQYSIREINNFTPLEYITNWFTLKGIKSYIHITFIILLLGFTVYAWVQKRGVIKWLWVAIMIKSILVLLFSAQYRFLLDVFIVIIFIIVKNFPRKLSVTLFYIGSFTACLLLTFPKIIQVTVPSFALGKYIKSFELKQLIEPASYSHNHYTTHKIGNMTFNLVSQYPYIFDTPPPSITPYHAKQALQTKSFPQWIDEKQLERGIISQSISQTEVEKLKKILEDFKRSYPTKHKSSSD